jgi:acyl dehydratase
MTSLKQGGVTLTQEIKKEVLMAKVIIPDIDSLKDYVGKEIGVSQWKQVTQEDIDTFAKATGDFQFIHTDPERARKESPYGRTIAHGFFTLSLLPVLRDEIFVIDKKRVTINYGLNKVRFPAPFPVGEKVRMRAKLLSAEDLENGIQAVFKMTFETPGAEKPTCVAEAVNRFLY